MAKNDRRVKYASDTEKPVMVSVRLPRELYDRLERYSTQHRQSISELLKDGVEMRLEVEADPRSRSAGSTTGETEFQIDGASILRDMQATLARHETQMHAIMQAIDRQTAPAGNGVYEGVSYPVIYSNTAIEPVEPERSAAQNPALAQGEVPAFDTQKHHLGTLCKAGHDYHGTGQSLRTNNTAGYCLACNAADARLRRLARLKPARLGKAALVERLQQMRDGGMSLSQIASQLQAEGLPTLSGTGQWQKGTVAKLLAGQTA